MNKEKIFTTSYFEKYTSLVNEINFTDACNVQDLILDNFFASISEEKSNYAYAAGKWTLKELLQHIIDTERIFCYRALAIARKETTTLPGFDENKYAVNSNGNARTWSSLVNEMKAVRIGTKFLFESFTTDMLKQVGNFGSAAGNPHTLGFIMIGHVYHHIKIVEERYF